MDLTCDDLYILAHKRRAYYNSLNNEQRSRICNVCKKRFPSGNKLFKHLKECPLHRCTYDCVKYEFACKTHQDYNKISFLNSEYQHFIPVQGQDGIFVPCCDVYIKKIWITIYRIGKNESYYVTDFNENDLKYYGNL